MPNLLVGFALTWAVENSGVLELSLESLSIKKQSYASWVSAAQAARRGTCISSFFLFLFLLKHS